VSAVKVITKEDGRAVMGIPEDIHESAANFGHDHRALMWEGIPASQRLMPVAGVSTAVLESGDGSPVVLLHSSGEFAGLWARVIPGLAAYR
jgi:hypothetical protein